MRKVFIMMLIVVCVCFLAITATAEPKKGGTLRVGVPADAVGLDPHKVSAFSSNLMLHNIYERLVDLSEDGKPMPGLATSWAISEDELVYTFQLRQGVKFHNGREMIAKDVKYSYDRLADPKTKAFYTEPIKKIKETKVLDKYTFQIILKKPMSTFLIMNANPSATYAIVPKEEVENQGGTLNSPVGTGPYKFVEYKPERHFICERFEDYKPSDLPTSGTGGKKPAYADRIKIIPIKEATVRDIALKKGEIDFNTRISWDKWDEMKANKDLILYEGPGTSYVGLLLGIKHNPLFAKKAFRKAIAYSLDKQAIVEGSVWGHSLMNASLINVVSPFFSDIHKIGYPKDLEKVKALLKEAGYEGEQIKISCAKRYPMTYKAAIVAQQQLMEAGINSKVEVKEWATLLKDWRTGQFDIMSFIWGGRIDPSMYMSQIRSQFNTAGYSNPKLDDLIDKAETISDFETRKQFYEQIHQIMIEECPWIKLYDHNVGFGAQKYVKGIKSWPWTVCFRFPNLWLDK